MDEAGQDSAGYEALVHALKSGRMTDKMVMHIRQLGLQNLYFFEMFVLGYTKIVPHIHRPLCEDLQDFSKKRIRCILPRGWYKTTIYSIGYPLWEGTQDPNKAILVAQNTATNAMAKIDSLGQHVTGNKTYRSLYPEVLPDKTCTWSADSKCLLRTKGSPESTFEAVGIRTQVTSRHYNTIIEDDTVAPDLDELNIENVAPSKEDIGKAIGWHRLCPPLLRDQKSDRIIVVGTRWFPEDLLEWIWQNEREDYYHYVRACRENERGESDADGRITFPEQFDDEILARLRRSMGPYLFRCLYLNQPVRSDDMIFDPKWFKHYDTFDLKDLVVYTTVDPSGDPEETVGEIDYNVVLTTGINTKTGDIFVIDYTRKKMNPGELMENLFRHVELYKPIVVGVETIAYQNTLSYHIKQEQMRRRKYFRVENLTHGKRAKNARIQGLQPLVEQGRLKFSPWMVDLFAEMTQFPLGKHDDIIDCLAMQIRFWLQWSPPTAVKEAKTGSLLEFDPDEVKRSIRRGMAKAGLTSSGQGYLTDMLEDGGFFNV